MTAPFWLMDPTGRFTSRALDYARHRPDYPEAAIDAVLGGLGAADALTAADVGAGTGILSRLLAARGVRVKAIEPNAAMRGALHPAERIEVVAGTAERTGLGDGAVDLVACAQSFHWFEPRAALAEFVRVLRPGGRLAILWNERNRDDAFTAAYSALLRESAGGRETEASRAGLEARLGDAGFAPRPPFEAAHGQSLGLEGLVGRALSSSYAPRSGAAYELLVAGLHALHSSFRDGEGRVRLAYRTIVCLAEAAPLRRTPR